MKKIFILLGFTSLLFTSCYYEDDSVDKDTIATTFEVTRTFDASNNYATEVVAPNSIEVLTADVPLVYILDPVKSAGENGDVWESLPKTFDFGPGQYARFEYNFIFNEKTDVASIEITLKSDDLAALANDITNNQVFRVVIVPSQFAQNPNIDLSDFNAVQAALNSGL